MEGPRRVQKHTQRLDAGRGCWAICERSGKRHSLPRLWCPAHLPSPTVCSSLLCCVSLAQLNMRHSHCSTSNAPIQEFNLSLLAPCLGLGLREISGGQRSPLFEAARAATLDRVSVVVQRLPTVHQAFQPFLPVQPTAYWSKLDELFGK